MLKRHLGEVCLLADRFVSVSFGNEPASCQPRREIIEILRRTDELFGTDAGAVSLPEDFLEEAVGLLLELEAVELELKTRDRADR
jgi:hypothetical protein